MDIEKFINSVRSEVAKRFDLKTDAEIDAFFIGLEESAKNNQEALEKRDKMLRDTVAELCEAKRLLKAAVDGFKWLEQHTEDDNGGCIVKTSNISCSNCPFNTNGADCKWKHEAEALKLIGGSENG